MNRFANNGGQTIQGIKLRDWFAGQCLSGLFVSAQREHERGVKDAASAPDELASAAYNMADAMLKARDK